MKCQYDQIDTKVKSKDIYKYFFKNQKNKTYSTKPMTPNCDLEAYIINNPVYPWIKLNLHKIKSEKQNSKEYTINLLEIKNENSKDNFYFIYSPDNLSNLTNNIPLLLDLSSQMKINIFTYDYSVTHSSKDNKIKINEENIIEDLKAVIKFIKTVPHTQKRCILIGNSIGSIPCLNYAVSSLPDSENGFLMGLILISPVGCSIDEEINKNQRDSLEQIRCPVFIIHGRKDSIINYHQSVNLGMKVKSLFEWYPKSGDHYNLTTQNRTKFLTKLKFFVSLILSYKSNENKEKANELMAFRNISFKFEDNFIIQQTLPDYYHRDKINFSGTKINSCFESYNCRSMNYRSNDDLISDDRSKVIFYPDNNFLQKSTCSSIKEQSPLMKPSPFSKKGDSFSLK